MSDVKQLNVKIDALTASAFAAMCETKHRSQAEVVQMLVTAWLENSNDAAVTHMDGSLCPLNAMIRDMARAVRSQLATTGFALPLEPATRQR